MVKLISFWLLIKCDGVAGIKEKERERVRWCGRGELSTNVSQLPI
jgi:hypothetical protein